MQVALGSVFGRLTVIEETRKARKTGSVRAYVCECSCGASLTVAVYDLKNEHTQSCGCLHRERTSEAKRIHGASHTSLYYTWQGMIERCYNPKNKSFDGYGARGITVCAEWKGSYLAFLAAVGDRPAGMTLERKDVNGNYEPGNVVWATPLQQARNKRPRASNIIGLSGVRPTKHGTFSVSFRVHGKHITRHYKTLFDAAAARRSLESKYWTDNTP